jgi:crotonobetainyl-CoA:carnitine CoA-transferase CaiB-like acyl-CoA transferase
MLDGIRVLSMGVVIAGPAAGAIMADWGADVIKVEPLTGELFRGTTKAQGVSTGPTNSVIQVFNRGMRGLAIDLSKESGREAFYKLVKQSDVFISNYEPGAIRKLKVDYASLSKVNPRLIHAVISGYGSKGPDKDERAFDFTAGWARSGLMNLITEPGCPPAAQRAGTIDTAAGTHVVAGVLAALINRERTGEGQEIEVSLYHTGVWTLASDIQSTLLGREPIPNDRTKARNPVWNSYKTKDGRWIWLAMLQPKAYWPAFCRAIEMPDLENDPKFETQETRATNCEELIHLIEGVIAEKTMQEWEKIFRAKNVLYGRSQTTTEVISDPQALENEFFTKVIHPEEGEFRTVATPVKFHQKPARIKASAPEIGQHTEEIFLDIGFSWDDIARLKEQGAIL